MKIRLLILLSLVMTVYVLPIASASPGRCDGTSTYDPVSGGETCVGIHYTSGGQIDCIGSYVKTPWTGQEACTGV